MRLTDDAAVLGQRSTTSSLIHAPQWASLSDWPNATNTSGAAWSVNKAAKTKRILKTPYASVLLTKKQLRCKWQLGENGRLKTTLYALWASEVGL